jgi:type I restriction enzyme S subunit
MMTEQAKVPAIRFAGFTDPWEQRKLSELLLERDEQAPQSDQYPLMAFIANQGIAPKGDRYDRSALVNDIEGKLYKRTEKGDFIYSSNNLETGSIGLNKYGNACISPVYSIFQPSGIADSDFLGRRLVRKDFIQEMVKWRQGVIYGQWRIHEADFLRLNIAVPSVDEQRLIGKLLDNLDSLITLHQRKYDKLVVFKKSMLEKMFPKDGESVPEIRFAGFTDPWEQRKLGELSSEFQSGDFISAEKILASGPYPVYGGNGLRGYAKRYNHDGFYALIGRQGALCGNVNTAVGKAYFTEHAVAIKANSLHDTRFLVHLLRCMDLGQYSGQSAQPGLAVGVLKEVETTVPSKVEQQAIGSFFSRLDDLITLHQRKLELLQNIKKSLLDKMFA